MLVQRLRRWHNIKTTLGQRSVFSGMLADSYHGNTGGENGRQVARKEKFQQKVIISLAARTDFYHKPRSMHRGHRWKLV